MYIQEQNHSLQIDVEKLECNKEAEEGNIPGQSQPWGKKYNYRTH